MAYVGFAALSNKLKGKVKNPKALAAAIGRAKYGKKKFQKAAGGDRKMKGAAPVPGWKGYLPAIAAKKKGKK